MRPKNATHYHTIIRFDIKLFTFALLLSFSVVHVCVRMKICCEQTRNWCLPSGCGVMAALGHVICYLVTHVPPCLYALVGEIKLIEYFILFIIKNNFFL